MNNPKERTMLKPFHVVLAYCVTHPELRGPTYPVVPAGYRYRVTFECAKQSTAVACFERVLAGGENFASEQVVGVEVLKMRPNASPKRVRRPVAL